MEYKLSVFYHRPALEYPVLYTKLQSDLYPAHLLYNVEYNQLEFL